MSAITVVGGAYRERCRDPVLNRLLGSGLRAAGALRSLGNETALVSCVDAASAGEAQAVADALQITATWTERVEPIEFRYETPVSPAQQVHSATCATINVEADAVVAFGMLECDWVVRAESVVVDPQHSGVASLLARSSADRTALVLNEHEARRATGVADVRAATTQLLDLAAVVIVKQGAAGGLVADRSGVAEFGAHCTATVCPIGSGDVFTAGFAHAWSADSSDPIAAARFGSQAAAAHSMIDSTQIGHDLIAKLDKPLPYPGHGRPRVYLAGPFFSVGERHMVHVVRGALQHLGVDVFSPLHDIGRGGDEVASKDLEGLVTCQSVLAILDGADPGTMYEAGWAAARGIPVVGVADNISDHAWTMLRGSGAEVTSDLSTAIYRACWAALSVNEKQE